MGVKKDFDNILDCFTAVDGGLKFATVKFALEAFEAKAIDGDRAAREIIQIVTRFSNLVDVLGKQF